MLMGSRLIVWKEEIKDIIFTVETCMTNNDKYINVCLMNVIYVFQIILYAIYLNSNKG